MIDIETRLFRSFVVLAQEQHFGRAALRLGISPPTLTHQIQKLESQLGTKLVERRGNTNIELTEPGVRFLQRARNVLREAEEARSVAGQAARGEIGRIEIGFMAIILLVGLIEKFAGGFRCKNPGVEIVLRQMVTADQITAILSGTLDFGFVRMPDRYPVGTRGFLVCRQPMLLALPAGHALASQDRIEPSSLKDELFINYSPDLDVGFWKHMDVLGNLGHFTPKVGMRVKEVLNILSYVSAGQGIAVVSEAFTKLSIPNVVYRRFATDTPPMSPMAFIYRQDEPSPAGQAFIKFMRQHAITS